MNVTNTFAFTIKLYHLCINHSKLLKRKFSNQYIPQIAGLSRNAPVQKEAFLLSIAIGFLWPIKRVSKDNTGNIIVPKKETNLEIADNLYENGHYEECLKLLSNSEDLDNVEVQWRLCRILYNMSKEPIYDKEKKVTFINKAHDIISKQIEHNQDNYAVHKWYALILDAKSAQEGIKERIKQLENVKKHMDLAVTLNPKDATTLHMLGEWCYQITEMPWHQRKIAEILFESPPNSTYEDALEYFLRAESVQPRFYSVNLLRLGNCYLKLEKEDQAKYYLKLAASYPAKSNDDHRVNKDAAELLKKLK